MKKTLFILALLLVISISPAFAANVYYVSNEWNGDNLYTADYNEYSILHNDLYNWNDWGVSWVAPDNGKPVYRLYNPTTGLHLYTLDTNEVYELTAHQGWRSDNNGNPVFYSGGNIPIYRLYDPSNGTHYLTANDRDYIGSYLNQEGVAMWAIYSQYYH